MAAAEAAAVDSAVPPLEEWPEPELLCGLVKEPLSTQEPFFLPP